VCVVSSVILGGGLRMGCKEIMFFFFFSFSNIFVCVFFQKNKRKKKNNVGLSRSCFNRFQMRNVCHSLNFCFFSSRVLLSHEMMENDRVLILCLCVRVFVFLSLIFVSFSSPACYWLALGPAISILQPIDVLFRSAPSLNPPPSRCNR
jgi:hypothetical protein